MFTNAPPKPSRLAPLGPAPLGLAIRFGAFVERMVQAVATSIARNRTSGPLIILIARRLRRMAARFTRLASQASAGTLPQPRIRKPRPEHSNPDNPSRPHLAPRPRPPLPDDAAWLLRLMPEVAGYSRQLRHLLSDPEMVALLAAVPQFGRILRPLCRALGLTPTPPLLLPQPARRVRSIRTQASIEPAAEPAGDGTPPRWRDGFCGVPPPKPA